MYTLVRQRDAKDCGPSCLVMIAEHYGHHFNIDSIRKIEDQGGRFFAVVAPAPLALTFAPDYR